MQPETNASHGANASLRLSVTALARLFRLASTEWVSDNAPRLGAAVAFYTLLSLAPIVVIAVAVAAVVHRRNSVARR